MTLIATARLHGLDPERYLRDLFHVFPNWPGDPYLEPFPRDWLATRSRLDAKELATELGLLAIPPSPTKQSGRDRHALKLTSFALAEKNAARAGDPVLRLVAHSPSRPVAAAGLVA
jgi:hypothetical protein